MQEGNVHNPFIKTPIQYTTDLDITPGVCALVRVFYKNDKQLHFLWCKYLDIQARSPQIHTIFTILELNFWYVTSSGHRHGTVILSKTKLSGGIYQIPLTPSGSIKLSVPYKNLSLEPQLVAVPIYLPIGWKKSHPNLSYTTKNVAEIANENFNMTSPLHLIILWNKTPPWFLLFSHIHLNSFYLINQFQFFHRLPMSMSTWTFCQSFKPLFQLTSSFMHNFLYHLFSITTQ